MNHNVLKPLILLLTLAAFVLVCAGCGKNKPAPNEAGAKEYSSTQSEETDMLNTQLFASAKLSQDRSEYLLGPGDLLEIKVFEAEKLNTTVRISSRGNVSLPLLGEVSLDGLTAAEAEKMVEDKYKETYIKDPHVSIFIKEHFIQQITVVGEVKNPGTYDYASSQRLLDAIALAGGLTEKAGNKIQVRRAADQTDETGQTLAVNLSKLINEGRTNLNVNIRGGDVIYVPEAGSFFVDGAVRRPGEYHIRKPLSIREAVLAAGGFAPYADIGDLVLLRETETGEKKEVKINLKKRPEASEEMTVQSNDIIMVNASLWGKILHGAGINIGVPGFGVSYRNPSR